MRHLLWKGFYRVLGVTLLKSIKDAAAGNLPIHIATTLGAPFSVLEVSFDIFSCLFVQLVLLLFNAFLSSSLMLEQLLVKDYSDGCYRKTIGGDLPLHLHVMSGMATPSSVELLVKPCAISESSLRVFQLQRLCTASACCCTISGLLWSSSIFVYRSYPPAVRETRQASSNSTTYGSSYSFVSQWESFNIKSDLLLYCWLIQNRNHGIWILVIWTYSNNSARCECSTAASIWKRWL